MAGSSKRPAPAGAGADDIENIFGRAVKKAKDRAAAAAAAADKAPTRPQVRTSPPASDDLGLTRESSTSASGSGYIDGLRVYTVEELKLGLGEDTDLCPFDCQCCF
ncbi:unnamed protein product (mitochondrion) [Plasmodiophora brassicae]|uniref:DUF1764 domain-containing protein n=1 Tax=Plasmodiophora brassicae TaxID=37360 RepID=A0A3P3YES0_PLABS|nr:unnamed protein product [Plasmodiophora brassicae]